MKTRVERGREHKGREGRVGFIFQEAETKRETEH